MKQGLKLLLPVCFTGVDLDDVAQIEFRFSQTRSRGGAVIKDSVYASDGSGECSRMDNVIYVPWTVEETYQFAPDASLYMDTRITLRDSEFQPPTNIVQLTMSLTLFEEEG